MSNRASDDTAAARGCGVLEPMMEREEGMIGVGLWEHSLDLGELSPAPRASSIVETKSSCVRA